MSSTSAGVEAVRGLLARLREVPNDTDTLSVLGDWCEERGFAEAALALREPHGTGRGRTLFGLQALFGFQGTEDRSAAEKYTAIGGLPRMEISPAETVSIDTTLDAPFRLRRVVLQNAASLVVHSLRVGMWQMIYNGAPVWGGVFGEHGPELCDKVALAGQRVSVIAENVTRSAVPVTGCLLGDEVDMTDRPSVAWSFDEQGRATRADRIDIERETP